MSIKFDRTYIAVRQRSILETFDLSTQIVRDHAGSLLGALLLGAFPLMVVNFLIIYRWIAAGELVMGTYLMGILVAVQAPLGTAVITDFLGSVMFKRKANILKSARNCYRSLGKFFFLHGIIRLALPVTVLVAIATPSWNEDAMGAYVAFLVPGVLLCSLLIRALRPFANEVILLEKPSWRGSYEKLTFSRRSERLHGPASAELFGKAIVTFIFGLLLAISFWSLFNLRSYIFGTEATVVDSLVVFTPLAFWLAAGFTTVARFLLYIDLRIKQEGWEVELKLRAEATKYLEKTHK